MSWDENRGNGRWWIASGGLQLATSTQLWDINVQLIERVTNEVTFLFIQYLITYTRYILAARFYRNKALWKLIENGTLLFVKGLGQNPLIFKIDRVNNYVSVWTVTREKPLPNWSKNMLKLDENLIGTPHVYTIASVPRFYAGFGKSDLMRVFWESRDPTNSTRSCIAAADMRKSGGKKDHIFSRRGSWYWKYPPFYRRLSVPIIASYEKDASLVSYWRVNIVHRIFFF